MRPLRRKNAEPPVKISKYFPTFIRATLRPHVQRAQSWETRAKLGWRKLMRNKRIRTLFMDSELIKISLGCGDHARSGWINTDYDPPLKNEILYLDATRRFPFPDQSVDYFHTEHMIEHVPLPCAQFMLKECYRTLKPGGKIRIATPDLMRIGKLLSDPDSPEIATYIQWALKSFPPLVDHATPLTPCMVFNNFVRDWGHQFIYDEKTLSALLTKCGFVSVHRCKVGESEDPHLRDLEMHHLVTGDAANNFETMVIEATKR
jgi:predicted SAM-dependent methyltransferase